jgi:hypothetical protein
VIVIASEAKQSIYPLACCAMDCFVAALLAMTNLIDDRRSA